MAVSSVAPLIALLAVLLLFLAWVGWFWFCRPLSSRAGGGVGAALQSFAGGLRGALWRVLSGVPARLLECAGELWRRRSAVAAPVLGRLRLALLLPIFVALLTLLVLFLLRDRIEVELPSGTAAGGNGTVSAVLGEERLLPPPVLPPSAFYGEAGGSLELADRDWSKLDPDFVQIVLRLLKRLEARGIQMTLVEGYRSPERQELLAARDVTVTQARGFASRHQYGLAVDLVPVIGGRPVFSEQVPGAAAAFQALGIEAEALGLVWGGRWSFRDLVHVEAPGRIQENMAARARQVRATGR